MSLLIRLDSVVIVLLIEQQRSALIGLLALARIILSMLLMTHTGKEGAASLQTSNS